MPQTCPHGRNNTHGRINKTCLLPTAYLPPIEYFVRLYAYTKVHIEANENFTKQTYRNRCIIATSTGPQTLTIPVEKPLGDKCPIRDVQISNHGNWPHTHWNALIAAYRNSPFFEFYADDFRPLYEKPPKYLFDFNETLRRTVCRLIDFVPNVQPTKTYRHNPPSTDDCRQTINPKNNNRETTFDVDPYYQVFQTKNGFLPNMSIVDLLFNMGPESLIYIHRAAQR